MKLQLGRPVAPVDFIVDNFERRKNGGFTWYSPPFFSHLGGYKMCLNVSATGVRDGRGTHVSVFAHLMKGEFDDLLKWPFCGELTIQLKKDYPPHYQLILMLDNALQDSVKKPRGQMNAGLGYSKYISHYELYAGGYLNNDKLSFCISNIVVGSK